MCPDEALADIRSGRSARRNATAPTFCDALDLAIAFTR
jgi:hypothetical protein